MRFNEKQIVVAQSMAVDIASAIIPIDQAFGYSIQANYSTSGTLGGVLAIQGSNDHFQDFTNDVTRAGNWVTIDSVTLTGAGSYMWNVLNPNYLYFRMIYTHTGGDSGTLNAYSVTKGF